MNFKFTTYAALIAFTSIGFAQDLSKAVINKTDGKPKQVLIKRADTKAIYCVDNPKDTTETAIPLSDIKSMFFYRPSSFNKGIDLYNAGKFDLAKAQFTKCKDQFSSLKNLDSNYSMVAAFYEMECSRRVGDLESLNTLLDTFRPDAIVNENFLTQLSIYSFWDAVRTKSWDRLALLGKQWDKKKLPGSQRAQVSYCHALALEAKGQKDEALLKFNEVIALSELKEVEIVENASEKIIELLLADPAVKARMDLIGAKDAPKNTKAYFELKEAASVATLWDGLTSQTRSLPDKYKGLLKLK